MLKDIDVESLDGVGVALVNEPNAEGVMVWNVYVVNYSMLQIEGVLVSSKGYGTINGEAKTTSVLRTFLDTIDALDYSKIEPIQEELFVLTNEYWLSYYAQGKMYERKFIFKENSVQQETLEKVGLINMPGILLL
ncbi:MAG: hypothetical protein CFE21_11200 [Bacteroidetes bacterium B1(2017)]|nr:MAG: hypothetical protein CFE21_11200 [Bacteroidetes bacterium B1(2017)]